MRLQLIVNYDNRFWAYANIKFDVRYGDAYESNLISETKCAKNPSTSYHITCLQT